jgi:hypothetical protein
MLSVMLLSILLLERSQYTTAPQEAINTPDRCHVRRSPGFAR